MSQSEERAEDAQSLDENAAEPTSEQPSPQHGNSRIDVLLKPTGDAPIMRKRKWTVERTKKISSIIEFVRRYLKFEPQDSLFLYVNQSFAPAPDVDVGTMFDCFGTDGKLVLHYCRTQAWG